MNLYILDRLKNMNVIFLIVALLSITTVVFGAPVGGSFESKMGNLQDNLIGTVLPIMAILGLVWAGILAATGNEAAKGKILLIVVGSITAFLAPHIIGWLKGVVG